MRRITVWIAGAFLLGIWTASAKLSVLWMGIFTVAAILLCSINAFVRFQRQKLLAFLPILCFLIGYLYMSGYTVWMDQRTAPYDGETTYIVGYVQEADQGKNNIRVRLMTESIGEESIRFRTELRLYDDAPTLSVGQRIALTAKLSQPTGLLNDGVFYYPDYLKSRRVFLSGSAKGNAVEIIDPAPHGWRVWPDRIQHFVKDTAAKRLYPESAGLFSGIMLGDRSGMSGETKEAFQNSGIAHVTAVSGLHVSIILSIMMLLFYFWGNKRSRFRVVYIFGILAVVIITGATPSVVRAATMIIVFEIGWIVRRESDGLTSLAIAALLLLLWNPCVIYDAGFRLSFAATGSILLFAAPLAKLFGAQKVKGRAVRFFLSAAAVTIAAQLGTLPISVAAFHQIPVLSVVTNILIAPLLPLILGSGILLVLCEAVFPPFGICVAFFLNFLLQLLQVITKAVAWVPFATLPFPSLPVLIVLSYFCALVFLFCVFAEKRGFVRFLSLSLCGVFLVSFAAVQWIQRNDVKVSFINVGQGDSALIKCGADSFMIDGGGNRYFDIGESVLSDYLDYRGIRSLSAAVVTHYDLDHYDGVVSLMKMGRVRRLYVPKFAQDSSGKEYVLKTAKEMGVPVTGIGAGDVIPIGEHTRLLCISPASPNDKRSENDMGIVLIAEANGRRFFFGGDISSTEEAELIHTGKLQAVDVLKADHHGSSGSNRIEFLNCISPEYVVISYGNNNYGFPSEETLARFRKRNAEIFQTKENGTVTFRVKSNGEFRIHTTQ